LLLIIVEHGLDSQPKSTPSRSGGYSPVVELGLSASHPIGEHGDANSPETRGASSAISIIAIVLIVWPAKGQETCQEIIQCPEGTKVAGEPPLVSCRRLLWR
jgi:hypothetical protein